MTEELKKLIYKNKEKIKNALVILLVIGVLWILHDLPILKYAVTGEEVYEGVKLINLSGKTVFISDMHLDSKNFNENSNRDGMFPVNLPADVENMVIVGDLFDSPKIFNNLAKSANGSKDLSKPFCRALEFVNNSPGNIYFVVGSPSHDPAYLADSDFDFSCESSRVHVVGRLAIFEIGGDIFAAHHGDYIAGGGVDCVVSYFSKKSGNPMILEKLWRNFVSLDENYWLITAHSHIPAIDYEKKVANAGAWKHVPIIGGDLKNVIIVENSSVRLVKLAG